METTSTVRKSRNRPGESPQRNRITPSELEMGCRAFEKNEGRDSMYRVASFLLKEWWGDFPQMVDALSVLLLTWNNAFYRYGSFNQDALEKCLRDHWTNIERFHEREITSLSDKDQPPIKTLFEAFLRALRIEAGKSRGRRSPVGVAKALHLLAPRFFPLWDYAIARQYMCDYSKEPAEAYVEFCVLIRNLGVDLATKLPPSEKSLVKRIDEYNYAKYTQGWI